MINGLIDLLIATKGVVTEGTGPDVRATDCWSVPEEVSPTYHGDVRSVLSGGVGIWPEMEQKGQGHGPS